MTDTTTVSAGAVIAAIEARRPGMKPGKLHSLLFFAQGHHVAHFGTPLFDEPIVITDVGVHVPHYGDPGSQPTGEGALNTIGYVIERYGALSPADLRTLIKASRPWATAAFGLVSLDDLRDWFRRNDETNDPDDERPNRTERVAMSAAWEAGRNA